MADTPQKPEVQTTLFGKVDAFMRSAANTMTFGYADKLAAWMDSKVAGGGYQDRLEQQKKITEFDNQHNSGVVAAGQVAGVVSGGLAARSVLGAGKAFVAAYTGAAAVTAVAGGTAAATATAGGATTATTISVAEGATVAAMVVRGLAKKAVRNPAQVVKGAGNLAWNGAKFIAQQATVIGAALGIEEGAKLASESVIGKAEAATGKDALETDKHKLADAGVSGAVAVGLAAAARGRTGVAATMVKGVALMVGIPAAVGATTEIAASTAASLEEGEHAAAARSAGVGVAAVAAAALAVKRGGVDLKSIWNEVTANPLVALATGAQVAEVVVDAAERTEAKLAAATKPTVVAAAESLPEEAPTVAPPASAPASEAAEPVVKRQAPRPHKASPSRPRKPRKTELAHAAEGTLVGITPEARVGLQVPDFSAQSSQLQNVDVPPAEKVAAAPTADESGKIDTSRLGELLQTDSVPNQALQQVAEPKPERQVVCGPS